MNDDSIKNIVLCVEIKPKRKRRGCKEPNCGSSAIGKPDSHINNKSGCSLCASELELGVSINTCR